MIELTLVTDRAGLEEAWAVRMAVFVEEQKVPVDEEIDAADTHPDVLHLVARADGRAVGTGRVLGPGVRGVPPHPDHPQSVALARATGVDPTPPVVHLGRLAVVADQRGTGLGAALVAGLEQAAARRWATQTAGLLVVELSAQEQAVGFYERCSYERLAGKSYLDAGIWHCDMARVVRLATP